jgi:cytochrome oxidase Cu insertion factor (SCO1/SenC/PrrC family)
MNRVNWRLTFGFLLCLAAFFSYIYFFSRFPITRDVPWVSLILIAVAVVLLISGARAAQRKVAAWIVAGLGFAIAAFFCFGTLVVTRWLPPASAAVQIGQHAPDFTLSDANGKQVALAALEAAAPKAVLLIFYRGYW